MDQERLEKLYGILESELEKLRDEKQKFQELVGEFDPESGPKSWRIKENVATRLENFYSGLERMMERVAQSFEEEDQLKGGRWHNELLRRMARETGDRPAIWSNDLRKELLEYLQFRHFFRSGYSSEIEWEKMRNLVEKFEEIFDRSREAVERFMNALEENDTEYPPNG